MPRLVAHRHTDVELADGTGRVLASHLEECHSGCLVDFSQLHFHLSFALLPSEIPAGASTGADIGFHPPADSSLPDLDELCEPLVVGCVGPYAAEDHEIRIPPACSGLHLATSNFKRICLNVWTL